MRNARYAREVKRVIIKLASRELSRDSQLKPTAVDYYYYYFRLAVARAEMRRDEPSAAWGRISNFRVFFRRFLN